MAQLKVLKAQRSSPYPLKAQEVAVRAGVVVLPHLRSGRAGRDKGNHFRIAYGSALEASAALELLVAVQAVPEKVAAEALGLLDSTRAMLWRLMQVR